MSGVPRGSIRFNVALQIVALAIVVFAANYFAFNHYDRADYSRSQRFVLSEQTKRVLKDLKQPVRVTIFFSPTSQTPDALLYRDLQGLLRELVFSGRKGKKIEIEEVDPTRNLSRARELQSRYKFAASENVVILEYEGRTKFIPAADLGEFDMTPTLSGDPARLTSFRGEQVLTNALIALVNPEKKKVYFIQGHGEPGVAGATPLTLFIQYLSQQNVEVAPLGFNSADTIPADARMVALIAPQSDLTEREAAILTKYWTADQGRLLVLLDPNVNTPRLSALLASAGITPVDDRVLRIVPSATVTYILREVTGEFLPKNPVTKRLAGGAMLFSGATQSLLPDEAKAKAANVQLWPLIAAAEAFWGEKDYIPDEKRGVRYDEGRDTGYPVYVSVAAARGGVNDDRVEVESSKLVVVGNCELAWDGMLSKQPNSLDFLLSSANWLLDRGQLTGTVPKNMQQFSFNLTDRQAGSLSFYTLVVMPGIAALLGIVAWLRRRS